MVRGATVGSFGLGRVAGVPVTMSWSVLAVLWLVAWSAAGAVLPETAPGYTVGEYWVAGGCVAVLLLISLVCHEVAHAVAARRAGLQVDGLTLWLFGGVTTLRGEVRGPREELRIALAGPLTSLALAGVLTGLVAALAGLVAPVAVAGLAWLAAVNLMLAVFNLLPGAPLDGGRVLRAVLWWRSGDRRAAELRATRAGRRTGALIVTLGLVEVLFGAVLGGVWLVLIGWFIGAAAAAEEQDLLLRAALEGLRVDEVMTPGPAVVPEALTVRELVEQRLPRRAHAVYPTVGVDGRLAGLLALERLGGMTTGRASRTAVADLATPVAELALAGPDDDLLRALERLGPRDEGTLVVVQQDRLVGIVTPEDVLRAARRPAVGPAA